MSRSDGRANDALRALEITTGFQKHAEGSVLIKAGNTWVLCAASVSNKVPPFLAGKGTGWVTAEYGMLPRSTHTRTSRDAGGRGREIQRLIGRSLRASVNMKALGERMITVDCDVLQADGGTRCASITGGWLALSLAVRSLVATGELTSVEAVLAEPLAAVSVGIIDGEVRLDLPYEEDARAEVDMNVVMTASGNIVEVQGTAEGVPFSQAQLGELVTMAAGGIADLCAAQRRALEAPAS